MAMKRKERYQNILNYFEANHPDAQTELEFKNPFQLLVAVILSAQCTDVRVNQTTPSLFNHYPDAKAMAAAKVEDVFKLIKSISYPNNKSKHLVAMSQMLLKDFNGSVPSD
ncbi:MAG: Endonuclease, partial [Bacteroidota bacterium]